MPPARPSTPPNPTADANTEFTTPHRQGSARTHFSSLSSQTTSEPKDTPPPSQKKLQNTVKKELASASFSSVHILNKLCPFTDEEKLKHVHKQLQRDGWETKEGCLKTDGWGTTETNTLYEKFASLLNAIRDALNLGPNDPSFFGGLEFRAHNEQMYDGIENSEPLKPDIMVLLRSIVDCRMNALVEQLRATKLDSGGQDDTNEDAGDEESEEGEDEESEEGEDEEDDEDEDEDEGEEEGEDEEDSQDADYQPPPKKGDRGDKVPWAVSEVACEIKNSLLQLFLQLATYGRAMFAVRPYRRFVPGLAFQQKKRDVTFNFFHRGGTVSSDVLHLTKAKGFATFVRHVCGMFSWTFEGAGMDLSRSLRYHFLGPPALEEPAEAPNQKHIVFEVKNILQNRACIRGRATRVEQLTRIVVADSVQLARILLLENRKEHPLSPLPSTRVLRPRRGPPPASPVAWASSSKPSIDSVLANAIPTKPIPVEPSPEDPPKDLLRSQIDVHEEYIIEHSRFLPTNGVDPSTVDAPITLVSKDSWGHRPLNADAAVFSKLRGKFGVPTLYGHTEVDNNEDLVSDELDLKSKLLPDARIHEKRYHNRTYFSTLGKELSTARKPIDLVRAVVHAMLGHWNIFKEGWLHRDVSNGNIMIIDEEDRDAVTDFEFSKNVTKCCGILIDADLARNLNDSTDTDKELSGTPPFISVGLHGAVLNQEDYRHKPADDLESALWVMVWEYLAHASQQKAATKEEIQRFQQMDSGDYGTIHTAKGTMESVLLRAAVGRPPDRPIFVGFLEFFSQWLAALDDTRRAGNVEDMYEKVLGVGFKHLDNPPDSWNLTWDEFFKEFRTAAN